MDTMTDRPPIAAHLLSGFRYGHRADAHRVAVARRPAARTQPDIDDAAATGLRVDVEVVRQPLYRPKARTRRTRGRVTVCHRPRDVGHSGPAIDGDDFQLAAGKPCHRPHQNLSILGMFDQIRSQLRRDEPGAVAVFLAQANGARDLPREEARRGRLARLGDGNRAVKRDYFHRAMTTRVPLPGVD